MTLSWGHPPGCLCISQLLWPLCAMSTVLPGPCLVVDTGRVAVSQSVFLMQVFLEVLSQVSNVLLGSSFDIVFSVIGGISRYRPELGM
jgi:hypothetical protein